MKNWKRVCMMAIIGSGVFGVQAFAAEKIAVPTEVEIQVNADNAVDVYKKTGYRIDGQNCFTLQVMDNVVHYAVQWDSKNKIAKIMLDWGLEDSPKEIGNTNAIATEVTRTVAASNGRMASMPGYHIDGHTYYPIRDIAKLFDYSCDWNAETKSIVLVEGGATWQRRGEISLPPDMNRSIMREFYSVSGEEPKEVVEETIRELIALKGPVAGGNDIIYLANSGVYDGIERYIKEHFGEDFEIHQYSVSESKTITGIPSSEKGEYVDNAFPPRWVLHFRYKVGKEKTNFGYTVGVYGGVVKTFHEVGEWNPDIVGKKFTPKFTKEEAIQKAINEIGIKDGYRVVSAEVDITFDMQREKFKYDITVFFMTGEGEYLDGEHYLFEE